MVRLQVTDFLKKRQIFKNSIINVGIFVTLIIMIMSCGGDDLLSEDVNILNVHLSYDCNWLCVLLVIFDGYPENIEVVGAHSYTLYNDHPSIDMDDEEGIYTLSLLCFRSEEKNIDVSWHSGFRQFACQ